MIFSGPCDFAHDVSTWRRQRDWTLDVVASGRSHRG
jgi:hypothetical protein